MIRSETVFAGYFKDPEATAAVLEPDGWLHSGDIATIDDDGFVTITDRKKDIIVTAGGKNIAPQNLENDLKTSRFVSQALVVGDRRPYPAALITLDPVEIGKWAAEQGIDGDVATLARDERVRRARGRHRRRRQPRALAVRAAQALRDPAAGLRDGAGRGDAHAQAQAPRRPRALRGRGRRAVRVRRVGLRRSGYPTAGIPRLRRGHTPEGARCRGRNFAPSAGPCVRQSLALALVSVDRARPSRPEAGSAGREARRGLPVRRAEGGGSWGNHGFPCVVRGLAWRRRRSTRTRSRTGSRS